MWQEAATSSSEPRFNARVKILLIRLRLIGDVVFTTPLPTAIRRVFPAARIAYLVEPAAAPVVQGQPGHRRRDRRRAPARDEAARRRRPAGAPAAPRPLRHRPRPARRSAQRIPHAGNGCAGADRLRYSGPSGCVYPARAPGAQPDAAAPFCCEPVGPPHGDRWLAGPRADAGAESGRHGARRSGGATGRRAARQVRRGRQQ